MVSPQSIFLALVTIIFMAGFLISENRSPEPIISLKFFRYREFILGNGAAFLSSSGYSASLPMPRSLYREH
jgi:hypothetical protein